VVATRWPCGARVRGTLPVTMEEMLHHTRRCGEACGARWSWRTCLGSFHAEAGGAVRNAIRFVKEAGAEP